MRYKNYPFTTYAFPKSSSFVGIPYDETNVVLDRPSQKSDAPASTLQQLYNASLNLLFPLTTKDTYKSIVQEARKLTGTEYGTIFLESEGKLTRVYASNPAIMNIIINENGRTYMALHKKKMIIDSRTSIEEIHPEIQPLNIKSILFLPLLFHNKTYGVINLLGKREKNLEKVDIIMLKLFLTMASLKIRDITLFTQTKKALHTRDLLISLAAHEFKTPLTVISGYSQLIQRAQEKKKTIKPEWIATLNAEVNRLARLITELMQVQKVHGGKLTFEMKDTPVEEILLRVKKEFPMLYPQRKLFTQVSRKASETILTADFDKVLQVIMNVLTNAEKFSPLHSPIYLRVSRTKTTVIFRIKDVGDGIKKEDLEFIFERFYKGSNSKEGLGLGLYLAKYIVENHRGEIAVSSVPEKGTVFTIRLPLYGRSREKSS